MAPLRGVLPRPLPRSEHVCLQRSRGASGHFRLISIPTETRIWGVWHVLWPGVTYAVTPVRVQGLLLSDLLMSRSTLERSPDPWPHLGGQHHSWNRPRAATLGAS